MDQASAPPLPASAPPAPEHDPPPAPPADGDVKHDSGALDTGAVEIPGGNNAAPSSTPPGNGKPLKQFPKNIFFNTNTHRVTVTDPETRGGMFSNHITYLVTVAGPTFNCAVRKRYSDFAWLFEHLQETTQGIVIPPLPEKKTVGNKEQEFIAVRQRALEFFLSNVVNHAFLASHPAVGAFVGDDQSWEHFRKEANKAPKVLYRISNHSRAFQEFVADFRVPGNPEESIVSVKSYSESLATAMTELHNCSRKLMESSQVQAHNLSSLQSRFDNVANLEIACNDPNKETPLSKVLVASQQSFLDWKQIENEMAESISMHLVEQFKAEIGTIQSFRDILRHRDMTLQFVQKVSTKLNNDQAKLPQAQGNAAEKLQKEIEEGKRNLEEGQQLIDFLSRAILKREIAHDSCAIKSDHYRTTMRKFILSQIEHSRRLVNMWEQALFSIENAQ